MANKIGFIHIPKTAGTAIRQAYEVATCPKVARKSIHGTIEALDSDCDVVFCVIREPYEWLFSLYIYSRYRRKGKPPWKNLQGYETFEEFVLDDPVSKIEEALTLGKQSDWVVGIPEENILLYENLESELKEFMTRNNGCHIAIKQVNPTRNKQRYRNLKNLSIEAWEKLRSDFADDYELYDRIRGMR